MPSTRLVQPSLIVGERVASAAVDACSVVPVGKRRDGGTRFWCLRHKADATAKYGLAAHACRYAKVAPLREDETLVLDISEYGGGVALWGAVPPVYDTTRQPLDRGIHVHARRGPSRVKEIDSTYRAVYLTDRTGKVLPGTFAVSELDAIYYMVSSIFGYKMKHVACPSCEYAHLDKDWFSVHPHRRHLCAGCGRYFKDSEAAIGNPVCQIRDSAMRGIDGRPRRSRKSLRIRQADYLGGLQIWGSNPALVWTGKGHEAEGIHVHAFGREGGKVVLAEDETFGTVVIDGVNLDPAMVRTLMAQSALPHIDMRVRAVGCPRCGRQKFDMAEHAYTPTETHHCSNCGKGFSGGGRLRKTIGNPLVEILDYLATYAPRPPQRHRIGLLPETL